jgi:heterodisulfide reductase subunit A2
MSSEVGVFLCRCSNNIAAKVDIEKLAAALEKDANVAFVESHDLLCAAHGQEFFAQKLKESDVSRVVVAACSPRDHESTFQKCMASAGRNRFLLQMANIREQCTWVTADNNEARAKAHALTRAAIRRVQLHEKLREKEIDCNTDVVVIGGGIAGIEAALTAAGDGRKVTLIEKGPSVGGMIARLEEVAPTMECAPCMLSPRISELAECDNIEVLTNCDTVEVKGYLGNFEVHITHRPRMVNADACIGCDECIRVCPADVPGDFDFGLSQRKAIDVVFPGCSPNCAVVDLNACLKIAGGECNACVEACPVDAMDFSMTEREELIRCGALVVATGATRYNPESLSRLGFGRLPEVYTHEQFARLTSNHGPTGGKILKKDGTPPDNITFIHCVGRAELGYCSRNCCEAALGLSLTSLEQIDGVGVVHLIEDVVCGGESGQRLLQSVKTENSRRRDGQAIHREIDMASVAVVAEHDRLRILWDDQQPADVIVTDMAVLVTGTVPSRESQMLQRKLDLVTTSAGFVAPDHAILRPCQTSLDGVFMAGTVAGGCSISESIVTARAAVGGVLSKLIPGKKLSLKSIVAEADSDVCSACGLCAQVCPFSAIQMDGVRKVALVNEVLCQGCGTCAGTCPSGAALARHFTEAQLEAEVEEVLRG